MYIIFRDFKSSNILLDEQWNAKLSDFGLAKLGPADGLSHVSIAEGEITQTLEEADEYQVLLYRTEERLSFTPS